MALFKYVRPARVDILSSLSIRFTPIVEFNDPFESMPDTSLLSEAEFIKKLKEDIFAQMVVTNEIMKATKKGGREMTFDEIRRRIDETYEIEAPKYRKMMPKTFKTAIANFRVLSLSRVEPDCSDALLLWGHYAQSHQGFVIELDEKHEWVTGHDLDRARRVDRGDVIYSVTRPVFRTGKQDREYYVVKAKQWEYEREHRLVRFAPSTDLDNSKIDSLVRWPPELLRSITLGVEADAKTEADIRSILSSTRGFAQVRLRRASLHVDEYRVEVNDI